MAFGDDAGWEAQQKLGLQDEYLILLGGPFAAAVLARGITGSKVENGTIQKTGTTETENPLQGLGELVERR